MLTNPLVVEAIESEFVPVLIINNRSTGEDPGILKRYKEPAWNYQVVRFLNGKGTDIIPRRDRVWTTDALVARMIQTLKAERRSVPEYLQLALAEADTSKHSKSAFAQHCFWTGELRLGQIDGVIATEAGWLEGREVTLVKWDKSKLNYRELHKKAMASRCADKAYEKVPKSYRPAKASDQKKQLGGTPFAKLELTPGQATKVNAFARTNPKKAASFLTPKQRAEL